MKGMTGLGQSETFRDPARNVCYLELSGRDQRRSRHSCGALSAAPQYEPASRRDAQRLRSRVFEAEPKLVEWSAPAGIKTTFGITSAERFPSKLRMAVTASTSPHLTWFFLSLKKNNRKITRRARERPLYPEKFCGHSSISSSHMRYAISYYQSHSF